MFGCKPVPSIKFVTNSLMYCHREEDMDINCACSSGEEEFAPWIIGPVM